MSTQSTGPVFPLVETDDGKYEIIGVSDTTKTVDQNIKMVLLTRKGEKIGRPAFGVGLHDYLFEFPDNVQNGSTQRPSLRSSIISQLTQYIPYINLQNVIVNFNPDKRFVSVKIQYQIIDSDVQATFDLTLVENGGVELY